MAKRRVARGAYRYTPKRQVALRRAQYISARRRKGHSNAAKVTAGIVGVGAVAYLGYRNRGTIKATSSKWKNVVSPKNKEATRVASSISVGKPSATTVISANARARATAARAELARPRPDRKIYDEDGSVNSVAMTERGVRSTLKKARRKTQGTKTGSLKGTPGGTLTPKKSKAAAGIGGFTEEEHAAATGMEIPPKPIVPLRSSSGAKVRSVKTTSKIAPSKSSAPKTTPVSMGWNDLMNLHKKDQNSIIGKRISLWSNYTGYDKQLKSVRLESKGYMIDWDTGEIGPFDDNNPRY